MVDRRRPGPAEQTNQRGLARRTARGELRDSGRSCPGCEPFEQHAREPAPVPSIGDRNRDLGAQSGEPPGKPGNDQGKASSPATSGRMTTLEPSRSIVESVSATDLSAPTSGECSRTSWRRALQTAVSASVTDHDCGQLRMTATGIGGTNSGITTLPGQGRTEFTTAHTRRIGTSEAVAPLPGRFWRRGHTRASDYQLD